MKLTAEMKQQLSNSETRGNSLKINLYFFYGYIAVVLKLSIFWYDTVKQD